MIYADYNGSAPLLPSVREHLKRRIDSDVFANPNAIHSMGQKINKGIEKCRDIIAQSVGCQAGQIFFNSGASEGITTIIHSAIKNNPDKKVVITSPIEHAVVLAGLDYFQKSSALKVIFVNVDKNGKIDLQDLERLIEKHKKELALVSIMAANNETGVVQPYREIASLCKKHDVEFFSDTTQLIGKGAFNFSESGLDYAVCSGHKVGALTGTGFIIAKDPTQLKTLIFGSIQEKGLRGGTQHYLGIETLAVAFQDYVENHEKLEKLMGARINFETTMKDHFKNVVIVGEGASRLAGTTLIGYPGIHGQAVQIELESQDIFVTTSAACSDNQPETSKVLRAMGIDDDLGRSVVRISLSYSHGEQEYAVLAQALKDAYNKLTKIHSF